MLQSTVIHHDDEGERLHLLKVSLTSTCDINRIVLDSNIALHSRAHMLPATTIR